MNGAELAAKVILNEGVRSVFALPSSEILPVCEYLRDEGVEVIFTRHEQAAGNAADGYARVTRNAGVCLVPTGPGLANLMPAIAQAYYASSPVVAIAGHSKYEYMDSNAFEEIDGYLWVKEYTKWSRFVPFTHRIHEYIQEAFRRAMSGRFGPSLLEIPKDILNSDFDCSVKLAKPENYRFIGRLGCDEEIILKSLELLKESEKPAIIAGSGVYWSHAEKYLVKFAEKFSIPVFVSGLGLGCIPSNHRLFAGQASASPVLREADLVFLIGTRMDEFLGFGRKFAEDARIVHVDIDPAQIAKNRYVDVGICCDAGFFLERMLRLSKGLEVSYGEWAGSVEMVVENVEKMFKEAAMSEEIPMKPQRLMHELSEIIGEEDIVVLDGGETTAWGLLYLKARRAGAVISSQGPFGHLGAGVPMGIAAKSAYPDRRVFVITGDGSFLFNGAEIDTAVRHGLQVIVVVVNDSAWGLVNHTRFLTTQDDLRARFGTILNPEVRYDKFGESLGAYGEMITKPDEIKDAVKNALDSGRAAVIDARVKLEEFSPLAYLLTEG